MSITFPVPGALAGRNDKEVIMPGFDSTGPLGGFPGRGLGPCGKGGQPVPATTNQAFYGPSRFAGMGCRMGRRRANRAFYGRGAWGAWDAQALSKEDMKSALTARREQLSAHLDAIDKQLGDLSD
jgi:hypothetical protein